MQRSDRLKKWLANTYRTDQTLVSASAGEIAARSLSNWKKGKPEPGAQNLAALFELGLGIDWYLVGRGSMFSESRMGRFWSWVALVFGDLDRLEIAIEEDTEKNELRRWINSCGRDTSIALNTLERLGLSRSWLVVGEGGMFSNSSRGRFWQAQSESAVATSEGADVDSHRAPPAMIAELESIIDKWR